MNTQEEMLTIWHKSVSVMHISHHVAAARYAKYHRWFGALVAGLSALVASTIFVAALDSDNSVAFLVAAATSLVTAVLTGINTSLDLSGRAAAHYTAAIYFQGLRREIEEEMMLCRIASPKENYTHIRQRWTESLEGAPPLPPDIHQLVKNKIEVEYRE